MANKKAAQKEEEQSEAAKMFDNLGPTLILLREILGKSQAAVAREAKIGKSQLSKYENGKELPKLDSLGRVLGALGIGQCDFFNTLELVNRRASDFNQEGGIGSKERPMPSLSLRCNRQKD
jgi:transcriptional regulator with XRE-family HTH domain